MPMAASNLNVYGATISILSIRPAGPKPTGPSTIIAPISYPKTPTSRTGCWYWRSRPKGPAAPHPVRPVRPTHQAPQAPHRADARIPAAAAEGVWDWCWEGFSTSCSREDAEHAEYKSKNMLSRRKRRYLPRLKESQIPIPNTAIHTTRYIINSAVVGGTQNGFA
jgi:hypothetical protein